jgi:hypothetical protein
MIFSIKKFLNFWQPEVSCPHLPKKPKNTQFNHDFQKSPAVENLPRTNKLLRWQQQLSRK